jgi:hypothetical protein
MIGRGGGVYQNEISGPANLRYIVPLRATPNTK